MSTLGLVAAVGLTVLLVVLAITVALVVRQVGILTAIAQRARDDSAPVRDGLETGAAVPPEVADLLPDAEGGVVFALVLGGSCAPCRDLLADLRGQELPHPTLVLVGSDGDTAAAMVELLPAGMPYRSGTEAVEAINALRTKTTPSIFEIADGIVTSKAALRGADHLLVVMADPQVPPTLAITKAGQA